MHQFFVEPEQINEDQIVITGADVNHIKNVLRMKPGEEISVSNGTDGKEYLCRIEGLADEEILCRVQTVTEEKAELPSKIYLFQGLPKADKMELIIQKAVELGVYEVIPVALKRSVVKLDAKKSEHKHIRWQSIAEAAAKQSKRTIIPQIGHVMDLQEAIAYSRQAQIRIIPYELAKSMEETRTVIEGLQPGQDIAVFIGPEGGFEEAEIEEAVKEGIMPVTLGKRILRTETAGMAVLAILMYHLEG